MIEEDELGGCERDDEELELEEDEEELDEEDEEDVDWTMLMGPLPKSSRPKRDCPSCLPSPLPSWKADNAVHLSNASRNVVTRAGPSLASVKYRLVVDIALRGSLRSPQFGSVSNFSSSTKG